MRIVRKIICIPTLIVASVLLWFAWMIYGDDVSEVMSEPLRKNMRGRASK